MRFTILIISASLLSCGPALAAQQGDPSTTSSQGSFTITMNGPATPRTVQVLSISDITINNTSRSEIDANLPGLTMTFCVVDTYSGVTRLSVGSANGSNSFGWNAVSTDGTQAQVYYDLTLTSAANNNTLGKSSPPSPSFAANLPAGFAAATVAACPSGNAKVHIVAREPMPTNLPAKIYSDTITLTLTPQ